MVARSVLGFVAMLACSSIAIADLTLPWAVGVTEDQKLRAKALLGEGNDLFLEGRFADALERFRGSFAVWEHPGTRFNIARSLIALDRLAEAADELELALAYGAGPLQHNYEQALAYQKLLAKQVGTLVVDCTDPGIVLSLDGHLLAKCPATEQRRVEPGPHQVVGKKPGHLTKSSDVHVYGGKMTRLSMSLVSLERAGTIVHRWPVRVPWIVFGGGVAIASIGGLLQLKSSWDMASYDRAIRSECRVSGCIPDAVDGDLKARARRENQIAIGLFAVGAAGAVVGGAMLYLNRARTVYPTVDVSSGGATIALTGGF
jgi:tetratricopeptide (TPR) repeat protein